MPVTIKVNGVCNSLVHKGSNGISAATIPDVCKTPSPGGPVPIPYPNISQSITLAKGTTTVKADGGMMIANQGSEFSLSNGDNAGVAGGVKSSTFMKESTWILYSFDVKMQGKGACRLTDKKFQNHENTVDAMGTIQGTVVIPPVLTFTRAEFPEKAGVMEEGMDGKSEMTLHRQTGRSKIRRTRRQATKGKTKGPPGTSLDEFPFASTYEGGVGAAVRPISVNEQCRQGGKMSAFYREHKLGDGDAFVVNIG
ncbi:MAG: DUF4150 domain-containing protein [Proteobacteria bacterium]|nr:DUF4150 domain-containing protein [Pseudomonadota bacterium]